MTSKAKSKEPGDATLAVQLGTVKKHWDSLRSHVAEVCSDACSEWKDYGAKHGWQLKVTHHKRALIYLIPHEGYFTASMAMNATAIAALPNADLPAELIHAIEGGRALPEGKAARVEVKSLGQVALVKTLLAVKLKSL